MFGRMDAFLHRLKTIKVTAQLSGHFQCQPQPGDPGLGVAQGELGAAWGRLGLLAQWDITGSPLAPFPAQCFPQP